MNDTQAQLVKTIQKLRLFQGFQAEDMQRLLPVCHFQTFEAVKKLYSAGDPSREMLILLMGKLSVLGPSGELLAEIHPGAPVGEMGVFTGEPRSADIKVAELTTGFVIKRSELQKVLTGNPDIHFKILRNLVTVLSERLVEGNKLNSEQAETIMKMQELLVKHTGMTAMELEATENQ